MKLHSAFDLSGLKASQLLQVVELDFLYPSEGIHKRWDNGYRITAMAATMDQSALILSKPRRRPRDETQETLRTTQFPSQHVKVGHELWYLTCFSLTSVFSYLFLWLSPPRRSGPRTSTLLGYAMGEPWPNIVGCWPSCLLMYIWVFVLCYHISPRASALVQDEFWCIWTLL